ncbi:MAG: hypothetical protein KDD49_10685 [Bacteroidetes bacterium]|nr:hypothetical protein [Bacteroidota bacterium]
MTAHAIAGTFAKPHKPTLKPKIAKEPPSQRTTNRKEMTEKQTARKKGSTHIV